MRSESPLVSIVIPCYNHEQFVQDSIQSVINQTYNNIELIIIDDGSKDDSVVKIQEMIQSCEERFTRFEFRSRPNKGLSGTLNEALAWCSGKYCSVIASDDQMLSEKTSFQVKYLEKNKEFSAVFGGVELIDENGLMIGIVRPSKRDLSFRNIILSNYTIMAPSQMIRMKAIKSLGTNPYPSHIKIEDWYMWLKLSETGVLKNVKETLVRYRVHDKNTMKNIKLINESRLEVLECFSSSVFYERALRLLYLINHIDEYKRLSISFLKSQDILLFSDVLFYKKFLQLIISRHRL